MKTILTKLLPAFLALSPLVASARKTPTIKVAASGEDYHGYAVEVYLGGELVSAKYSHPSIERELWGEKKRGLC